MLSFFKKHILPILLSSGFLLLYASHVSISVYGGDVGDLVTAAATGGVAHPPGYPLFVLLGFLLTRTPLAMISPAFAVGLISSIASAAAIGAFYSITYVLTKNKLAGFIASCTLGFSYLFWFYAEIAEVFALNVFFAIFLFLFAILYRNTKKTRYIYLFALFFGLSCTNHQTIIFIFPSLFLIFGKSTYINLWKKPKTFITVLAFLLIGLTPFLYIPIASSFHPIINWDRVHDFTSFFHLILRGDYGTFQAGLFDSPSFLQRLITVWVYLRSLVIQLTIPVVLLTIFGYIQLFKKDKVLSLAFFLAWILSGPIFLAYAGFPLTGEFIIGAYERFTLLSTVIFLLPFGIGLFSFATFLAKFLPKRNYVTIFQLLFLLIPLMLFLYNSPKTNLRTVNRGDTYAKDYLSVLPPNAVLLISGDTQIFNTWYMHFVLHIRPDVLLYNIGATPITHNRIAEALKGVSLKKSTDVLAQTVQELAQTRPVFSNNRFQSKNAKKIIWVPYGLTYQMYTDVSQIPSKKVYENMIDTVWAHMHVPTKKESANPANHSLTIVGIPDDYSNMLIATGTFIYSQYKDTNKTLSLYEEAVTVSPTNEKAYFALGVLYSGMGRCGDSIANLTQSLAINAYQELPYFLLYNEYKICLHDTQKANAVSKTYTDIFRKDMVKEMEKSKTDLTAIDQTQ